MSASRGPDEPGRETPMSEDVQPVDSAGEARDGKGGETPMSDQDQPAEPGREARAALEAILLVADRPVEPGLLAQLLEVSVDRVADMCSALAEELEEAGRGFTVARVAGGYRFETRPEQAPYVERFVLEGQSSRLSAAALETLSIIAYKQPVSRAQVAAIRGVNADGVIRSLIQRGYVTEVGRDPGPGQAVLLGTTEAFLERLGLGGLEDLPPLGEFVPGSATMEALERGLRTPEEQSAMREATSRGIEPDAVGATSRGVEPDAVGATSRGVEPDAVGATSRGVEPDAVGATSRGVEPDAVGATSGGVEPDAVGATSGGVEPDAVGATSGGVEPDAVEPPGIAEGDQSRGEPGVESGGIPS